MTTLSTFLPEHSQYTIPLCIEKYHEIPYNVYISIDLLFQLKYFIEYTFIKPNRRHLMSHGDVFDVTYWKSKALIVSAGALNLSVYV